MKNILMIATYFPPMAGIGTVRITKFVKYLPIYGWNPTVVTIGEKNIPTYDESLLKDIKDNINVIRIDFKQKNKDISKDFYKALKKEIDGIILKNKYDAVFITGGPFYIFPIGKYIFEKYNIPYIIDFRDPWKLQRINDKTNLIKLKSKIKRISIGRIEKKILKKASLICTVNDTMTDQYKKEYPMLQEKIYTITNGFDKDDYEKIQPKKFEKFTIVYTGKFGVSAGFRDPTPIFKVIHSLNQKGYQIEFIHVGKEEDKIIELAKKFEIINYCKFVGFKPFKEANSYCKGASLLLLIGGKEKSEQTGKIFDYIGCQKNILAITTGKSEIDTVCKNVNIETIRHEDLNKIEEFIKEQYNNHTTLNMKQTNMYDRKVLTGRLAQLLDKLQ